MGTEGLSAGDILALTKDNDNGMSGAWNSFERKGNFDGNCS